MTTNDVKNLVSRHLSDSDLILPGRPISLLVDNIPMDQKDIIQHISTIGMGSFTVRGPKMYETLFAMLAARIDYKQQGIDWPVVLQFLRDEANHGLYTIAPLFSVRARQ